MAEPFNGKEYRQGLHAGYLAAESQDPVKPCPNTHRARPRPVIID